MKNDYMFTSESVSEGHPDKICDRISDAVVDLMLKKHSEARVACETMVSTNRTIIAGEYRLQEGMEITDEEIEKLVRDTVCDIGYEQEGFHWEKMHFECHLHSQSSNIAIGGSEADLESKALDPESTTTAPVEDLPAEAIPLTDEESN